MTFKSCKDFQISSIVSMLSIETFGIACFHFFFHNILWGSTTSLGIIPLGRGYSEVHCPISDMRISSLLVLEEISYFGSLVAYLEPKS